MVSQRDSRGSSSESQIERKKNTERRYLNSFFSLRPDLKQGRLFIHSHAAEPPDFSLRKAGDRIAIEVTRLLVETEKKLESNRRATISVVRSLYESRGLPNCHINIFFSPRAVVPKERRQRVAGAIVEAISILMPKPNSTNAADESAFYNEPDLCFVGRISIARFDSLSRTTFGIPEAGWIQGDIVETVQDLMSKKASRIEKYRLKCSHKWLVIVVEGFSPSSFFEPSKNALSHEYSSAFDGVFIVMMFQPRVYELNLR